MIRIEKLLNDKEFLEKLKYNPRICAARGRTVTGKHPRNLEEGKKLVQWFEIGPEHISNTLTTIRKDNYVAERQQDTLRIRKLTGKECYRLMGFNDEDYDAAHSVVADNHIYIQAGNSIVVPVLEAIFKQLI